MRIDFKAPLLLGILSSFLVCLPYPLIHILSPARPAPFSVKQPAYVKIDEVNYAARVREVYDGNYLPTDVQLAEHKKDPGIREIFPILLAGALAKVSRSILFPFILFDFLMPFLSILLYYAFLKRLTPEKWLCLTGSFLLFFYFERASLSSFNHDFLKNVFKITLDHPVIEMERFPSPQLNFPLLLLFFYSLLTIFLSQVPQNKGKSFWILGVLHGIFFYSYFYYSVFLAAFSLLLLIYFILLKKKDLSAQLVAVEFVALMIALPYLLMVLQARQLVPVTEITERFGLYHGHYLYKGATLQYGLAALLGLFFIRRKSNKDVILFLAVAAGLLLLNQQVFTGRNLHPMHWLIRIVHPFALLSLINLTGEIHRKNSYLDHPFLISFSKWSWWILSALVLITVMGKQIQYGFAARSNSRDYAEYRQVYEWFSKTEESPAVILSPDLDLGRLLLIHTPQDVYLPHFSGTLASNQELEERLTLAALLLGFQREEWRALLVDENDPFLKSSLRSIFGNQYFFELHRERQEIYHHDPDSLAQIKRAYKLYLPGNKVRDWMNLYDRMSRMSGREWLERYRLDYVILNGSWRERFEKSLPLRENFVLAFKNEGFDIYRRIRR